MDGVIGSRQVHIAEIRPHSTLQSAPTERGLRSFRKKHDATEFSCFVLTVRSLLFSRSVQVSLATSCDVAVAAAVPRRCPAPISAFQVELNTVQADVK